jgi:hypothetical protein
MQRTLGGKLPPFDTLFLPLASPQGLDARHDAARQQLRHVAAVDIRVLIARWAASAALATLQKPPARAGLAAPWTRSCDTAPEELAGGTRHTR